MRPAAHGVIEDLDAQRRTLIQKVQSSQRPDEEKSFYVSQVLSAVSWAEALAAVQDLGLDHSSAPVRQVHYADVSRGVLGCKHYARSCMKLAPCCNKFVVCRLCHDETSDHRMDRFSVERVLCMVCWTEQPFSAHCISPACKFAPNFSKTCCFKCRLLTHQQTVHCDQCGVCRVGKPGDFQHCARCDVCVRRESFVGHPCVPGAHRGNCPICCETMRVGQSADAVVVSLCGHPMHDKCLARYVEYDNYKCPLCSRLLGDMSKQFAELHDQVLAQPMPPTYSLARSRVRCICCSAVSVVPFHFLGHECLKCGSFNTQVLATDGLPEIRSALPAEVMDVEAMDISE